MTLVLVFFSQGELKKKKSTIRCPFNHLVDGLLWSWYNSQGILDVLRRDILCRKTAIGK